MAFLKFVGGAYVVIGALNSLYLGLTVGINQCSNAVGVWRFYCNTGDAISHFVAIAAWPLFWI